MPEETSPNSKSPEMRPQRVEGSAAAGEKVLEVKPPALASPEEQMAAFEDALKESDWGHQPC